MEFLIQVIIVFTLVLLNGYFVASEFALVAIRKTRVEQLARKGVRNAKILKGVLNNLDNYISATQLGITLASLALGWVGEPALAHKIEPLFHYLPPVLMMITTHAFATIVAFSIITFLHIVLGELAPKTLALQRSERVALIIVVPLVIFTKIFKPFIWVLNKAGQLVLKSVGLHAPTGHQLVHSEEELRMLMSSSALEGEISSKEAEMVNKVFQLGDTPVKYAMIPRTEIKAFSSDLTLEEVVSKIKNNPHSRFPIYENNLNSVVGFIHVKDVYKELFNHKEQSKISELDIMRNIINIPEIKKIDAVLQDMRKKRIHIAVVNNEYGDTSGIITLEDIIESLVGEIEDEFEQHASNIEKQKDGSYLIKGSTLISDLQKKFKLPLKGQGYTTLGGLMFGLLGHEPIISDSVEISNLKLVVKEVEGKRIKFVILKKIVKRRIK